MNKISGIFVLVMILTIMLGCSHQGNSFQTLQMETTSYDAHFPDMDTSGDGLVSWTEFNYQFPDAEKEIFNSFDLGKDGNIDHEEWHEVKSASGLTTHKSE